MQYLNYHVITLIWSYKYYDTCLEKIVRFSNANVN